MLAEAVRTEVDRAASNVAIAPVPWTTQEVNQIQRVQRRNLAISVHIPRLITIVPLAKFRSTCVRRVVRVSHYGIDNLPATVRPVGFVGAGNIKLGMTIGRSLQIVTTIRSSAIE